jgi:hypothetical protein
MFASANTPPSGDNMQIGRDYTAKHSRIVECSACGGKVFLGMGFSVGKRAMTEYIIRA